MPLSRRHKTRASTIARVTLIATAAAIAATSATIASAAVPAIGGTRRTRTVRGGTAAREPVRETPATDAAGGIIAVIIAGTVTAPRGAVFRPCRQPIDDRRYGADRGQKSHRPTHPNNPLTDGLEARFVRSNFRSSAGFVAKRGTSVH